MLALVTRYTIGSRNANSNACIEFTTTRTFDTAFIAFFVLELPGNAPNAIRQSNLVLVITSGAILARFIAGKILELTGVTFGTICGNNTANHFFTGGAQLAQFRFGWVGEGIVGTICGRVHAGCRYKLIASGGSAIFVDV